MKYMNSDDHFIGSDEHVATLKAIFDAARQTVIVAHDVAEAAADSFGAAYQACEAAKRSLDAANAATRAAYSAWTSAAGITNFSHYDSNSSKWAL